MIISIDGPDGVGKTTHCSLVLKFLNESGHNTQYRLAISQKCSSTRIRSLIDVQNPPFPLKSRFLLYCGIIYEQNYKIFEKYSDSLNQHIIVDRFIETLICSNTDSVSEYEMERYYNLARNIFPNYDKYIKIVLNADLQTTIDRVYYRKKLSDGDKFYINNSKNIHKKFQMASKVGKIDVFNTENDELHVRKCLVKFLESKILF